MIDGDKDTSQILDHLPLPQVQSHQCILFWYEATLFKWIEEVSIAKFVGTHADPCWLVHAVGDGEQRTILHIHHNSVVNWTLERMRI